MTVSTSDQGIGNEKENLPKSCFRVRHLQALLLFLAMTVCWSMRVNINLGIVEMTNLDIENSFDWSTQTKSVILSSFVWGYIVLQLPGGMLATKVGAKWLLFALVFINSIVCILTPTAAYVGGYKLVVACRVMQGLAQGSLYPSVSCLIAKWIPIEERGRLGTVILAGANLGMAFQYLASGLIAGYLGWPAIFYVNGAMGAVWCIIYFFFGSNSPYEHKSISNDERILIQTSLNQVRPPKKLPIPWRAIWTSWPVFALVIVNIGHNWGLWTISTFLPSYMKQIQGVDIKTNGVVSAIPYFVKYLCSFPFGFLSDYVLKKGWCSTTAARKFCNTIAFWGAGLALIALAYAPAGEVIVSVLVVSLVVGINSGHFTGFMLVYTDMTPNFAGITIAIGNGISTIASISAPLVAGVILQDETSVGDWRNVFLLATLMYFITNTIFLIFATSETQSWNDPEKNTKEKSKKEYVVVP